MRDDNDDIIDALSYALNGGLSTCTAPIDPEAQRFAAALCPEDHVPFGVLRRMRELQDEVNRIAGIRMTAMGKR